MVSSRLALPALLASSFLGINANVCTYPSSCWPSDSSWAALNQTLQGNLIRAHPPAAPCHDPFYDEAQCAIAKANWINSFWRAEQPGGMQDTAWENGDTSCYIDGARNVTCDQGLVPIFTAAVRNVADVQAALNFANHHKISTRVKGAAHDYLGKSSGKGTFGIQTIHLKGITFDDHFVPTGCHDYVPPQTAVKIAAGEHWFNVSKAADAHGVVVVGGASYSVGAAGGWALGGGHSSLSPQYGLGVDNILQFEIVTLDGKFRIANACTDPDLFWALKGGGGGFGVTTSVIYKTHPPIPQLVEVLLNATYPATAYHGFLNAYLELQPVLASANFSGYTYPGITTTSTLAALVIPNSADVAHANQTLKPLWDYCASVGGSFQVEIKVLSNYFAWYSQLGGGNEGGKPAVLGSRLLPRSLFESPDKREKLTTLLADLQYAGVIMHLVAGGEVSKPASDAAAIHPSWRQALHHVVISSGWNSTTPLPVQNLLKDYITNQTQVLGALVPGFGSYHCEADHNEPNWADTFWGPNYARLLKIKQKVDPQGILTCGKCVGDAQ